ncbi:MAG: hypothetical protein H6581_25355 [Bacteroidia bacterium]|nr:hypothetical protein [Bacteroidia bacterium]
MKQPDPLVFELVKSLSKGEKDNLIRFACASGKTEPPHYLALFRLFEGMETYNEEKAKASFAVLIPQARFADVKRSLRNVILKNLREYGSHNSVDLKNKIHDILNLIDRGFLKSALADIKIAMKTAIAEERFEELISLITHKHHCLLELYTQKEFEREFKKGRKYREWARERQNELDDFQELYRKYYFIIKKKQLSTGEMDLQSANELERKYQDEFSREPLSVRALRNQLEVKLMVSNFRHEFVDSLRYYEQIVALYEENPFLICDHRRHYLRRLDGLASLYFGNEKVEKGWEIVDKMKAKIKDFPYLKWEIMGKYYRVVLANLNVLPPDLKIDQILTEAAAFFHANLNLFPETQRMLLAYQIAWGYFCQNQQGNTLKWLFQITNYPNNAVLLDLQAASRVLYLVSIIELRDYEKYCTHKRNLEYYLTTHLNLHSVTKSLFSVARQTFSERPEKLKAALLSLKAELQQHKESITLMTICHYFDLKKWVEEKL